MGEIVFIVVESSEAGDYIVGAFSTLAQARAVLPSFESGRLDDFRIEYQALDEPLTEATTWQVSLRRDGSLIGVEPLIGCAYCDEDHTAEQASFIEAGGELMRLAVWARTPGAALIAAREEARRLQEAGIWGTEQRPLRPLRAEAPSAP